MNNCDSHTMSLSHSHIESKNGNRFGQRFLTCHLILIALLSFVLSGSAAAQTKTMNGYCPVTILESKKWQKGDTSVSSTYDNRIYNFVDKAAKEKFEKNPAKYVPALGGDCIVCLIKVNQRIPGSVFFSIRHKDRLYLFPNEPSKKEFKDDLEKYEFADVAYDGNCAVCMKGGKKEAGKAEFSVVHKDFVYRFASKEIMEEFKRNPAKYEVN